jgi:hypothetical protein
VCLLAEELARLTVKYPKKYERNFKIWLAEKGLSQKEVFTQFIRDKAKEIEERHPTFSSKDNKEQT